MKKIIIATFATALIGFTAPAMASSLLEEYAAQAKQETADFNGFSAERGKVFYLAPHTTGKMETPACTSCHTQNPVDAGFTRAGKQIAPMAISRSPDRYNDKAKVEKWFQRNCNSVLGRACSALEKGDFITFMQTQ